ncbi:MAG TPA: hypothetical protein VFV67_28505 [Actinophytocola sp.]|uniref:hypothetical protein n=1 Tax=Actinophytocola sp. TaxID=1872138 RepID=UPI002DBF4B4A|nr:hypothetical protein [Actinophytocola sp.]HEU5474607.1 hypothetical protein [Actinophytocola sp.]
MPGSRGYGVESGHLRQVAREYNDEGADIIALKDNVVTNAGEGQFGRKFGAVAAPYRAAFDQFGRNLARYGDQAIKISVRLTDVATAYARHEDRHVHTYREVY